MASLPDTGSSADFFFRQDSTLEALSRLSAQQDIVIYSGAGVSIDRTGMSWSALVRAIFNSATANLDDRLSEMGAIRHLLDGLTDQQQAASIVIQAYLADAQSENDFLASKLKDILYERSGWDRGLMIRHLAAFAALAASRGRTVRIITTNYDVYLEQEIDRTWGLGGEHPILVREQPLETPRWKPGGSNTGSVEVVYLHGRVDVDARVDGRIVLTEESYADTQARSLEVLTSAFHEDAGILIVGASLTDTPLIAALASGRRRPENRYALLSTPRKFADAEPFRYTHGGGTAEVTPEDLGAALALRGAHLGVQILRPISHTQSAQFVEELRLALSSHELTGTPGYYAAKSNGLRYPERLNTWYRAWKKGKYADHPEVMYKALVNALVSVTAVMDEAGAGRGEELRIEAWVRQDPSRRNRTLTLISSTAGPIRDASVRRREAITPTSHFASVRALLEGRPQLVSLDDLGQSDNSSRWKTFLSVPVFAVVPVQIAGVLETPILPVGVITLASLRAMKPSAGRPGSFLARASNHTKDEVKARLLGVGNQFFSIQTKQPG